MFENQGLNLEVESSAAGLYVKPEIVHELQLETRAGSPLGGVLIDPLGVDPAQPQ